MLLLRIVACQVIVMGCGWLQALIDFSSERSIEMGWLDVTQAHPQFLSDELVTWVIAFQQINCYETGRVYTRWSLRGIGHGIVMSPQAEDS